LRLLLDSHVVLWLSTDVSRHSSGALKAIVDEASDTLVSAVSVWELEIKRVKGQLESPADLLGRLEDAGFRLLSLTPDNALDAAASRVTTATRSTACSSRRRRARRRRS